jgi:hypothetical protein
MIRRTLTSAFLVVLILGLAACSNKRVQNPMADLDSKQPDKVLFDNAMEALKKNKFDVARLSLQTLINTYPDSEYIARAKLGVADAWYFEGAGPGRDRVQGLHHLLPQHERIRGSADARGRHPFPADGKTGSRFHPCQAGRRRIQSDDPAVSRLPAPG